MNCHKKIYINIVATTDDDDDYDDVANTYDVNSFVM